MRKRLQKVKAVGIKDCYTLNKLFSTQFFSIYSTVLYPFSLKCQNTSPNKMDFLCIIHTHDPIRKDTVSICLYFIATKQIGTSKNVILGKGKDIKIWTCSLFLVCTICYNFILFNDVRISF